MTATPAATTTFSTTPRTTTTLSTTTSADPASGVLRGWQLNASNTGLGRLGLRCGELPVYTGGIKPASGTVIFRKQIRSVLDLSAGNIVIDQSCIRPTSAYRGMPLIGTTDYNNCCVPTKSAVTIRDSEIDGSLIDTVTVNGSCAFLGIGDLVRNYIHDMGSGICFYYTGDQLSARAEGNYVHRLRAWGDAATSGSHNESFTIRDFPTDVNPSRTMKVVNNRLDSSSGNDTGAFFINTYMDDIDNVYVIGNLLEGNGYQLILTADYGHIYGRSMHAVDNRFSGTGYGPAWVDGLSYGWSEWQGNFINDPSQPNHEGRMVEAP